MRRFLFAVPIVVAAVALTACGRSGEEAARRFLTSGEGYLQKGQLKAALIELQNAVKAKPDFAEAHEALGRAYKASGEPGKAYASFARAGELRPDDANAHLQAGTLLLAAGDYRGARSHAERAVAAAPTNASAHILLGNALAGAKETRLAIEQMEQAIALNPDYAPAWAALGGVTLLKGDRDKAAEAYQRAVQLAPESADAHLALANFYWLTGDIQAAERTLLTAHQVDQRNPLVHRALATLYLSSRRAAQAEPHFKALAATPSGRIALASYYAAMGRKQDARVELDGVLERSPQHAGAHLAMAQLLLTTGGETAEVERHAREAVRLDPNLVAAGTLVAMLHESRGDGDAARAEYERILAIRPRAAIAANNLAWIYAEQGRIDEAIALAGTARDEMRRRPEPEDTLGWALLKKGLVQEAIGSFERAVARAPKSPTYQYHLGLAYANAGNTERARVALTSALSLQPDFAGAADARHVLSLLRP